MKTFLKLAVVTVLASMLGTQNAKAAAFAPASMYLATVGFDWGTALIGFPVGECGGISSIGGIDAEFSDASGNFLYPPAGTTMTMTVSAGNHVQFYSDSKCTQLAESPYPVRGPIFVKDGVAETVTISASSSGVSTSSTVDFISDPVATVQIRNSSIPGWNTYSAGWAGYNDIYNASPSISLPGNECIGGFYAQTLDASGNPVNTNYTLQGNPFDAAGDFQVFSDAACTQTFTSSPLKIPAGSSTSPTFYIKGAPSTNSSNLFYMPWAWPTGATAFFYAQMTGALTFSGTPAPTINSFAASSLTISKGQSVTLTWSTTNATTVTISGIAGAQVASGSKIVTPLVNTTYTLTATNSYGTTSKAVTVTVNHPPITCETGGGCNGNGYSCQSTSYVTCSCTGGKTPTCGGSQTLLCNSSFSCTSYDGCGGCQ